MFVRHARLPRICRRSSLFKQLVFGVQSVKVVRKPCKKVAVRGHALHRRVGAQQGYCIFTEFNISILKYRPRNFLGLNHDAPQRVPFVKLFLCKKRTSRILSINCGSRVVLGLKWFECLQVKTSSFPRATDSEPNRLTVFLACKTAPNSRRRSLFRQTMQF